MCPGWSGATDNLGAPNDHSPDRGKGGILVLAKGEHEDAESNGRTGRMSFRRDEGRSPAPPHS